VVGGCWGVVGGFFCGGGGGGVAELTGGSWVDGMCLTGPSLLGCPDKTRLTTE